MVILETASQRQAPQRLPFCYLCGTSFGDDKTKDHIPPKTIFSIEDRDPLILPTHRSCNGAHNLTDEMMGQLFSPRSGRFPKDPANVRLKIQKVGDSAGIAAEDLNIKEAIWRWISGFHAALYGEPAVKVGIDTFGTLETPFALGQIVDGVVRVESVTEQHRKFVQAIKDNRAKNNLDRIICNKDKFLYECFWAQSNNSGPWMCVFALNIYDWKGLGPTDSHVARGCAGLYSLLSGAVPENAAIDMGRDDSVINTDASDPFSS